MRLHQRRTCSRWTIRPCIPAPSVAHANGSKASPTLHAHPVGIGMARHPRRSWSSRRTQDDQRPPPPSSAAVARQILMQIHAVLGSTKKTERDVDDFCSWIEVQVMTELFGGLPKDKQEQ